LLNNAPEAETKSRCIELDFRENVMSKVQIKGWAREVDGWFKGITEKIAGNKNPGGWGALEKRIGKSVRKIQGDYRDTTRVLKRGH
jgi:hypothetical protein